MNTALFLKEIGQHLDAFEASVDLFIRALEQQPSITGTNDQKIHMSSTMWNYFCNYRSDYPIIIRPFLSSSGEHSVMQFDMQGYSWNSIRGPYRDVSIKASDFNRCMRIAQAIPKTPAVESVLNGYLTRWQVKSAFLKEKAFRIELDTPDD